MAKETVTEVKTVEEEREVKICDYCQLISSDDIDEDEQFHEILLNPKISNFVTIHMNIGAMVDEIVTCNNKDNAQKIITNLLNLHSENTADLCPACKDGLFGDGPATGIRSGTGYID